VAETVPQSSYQPLGRRSREFFQVTFSNQSMAMLNDLPMDAQLKLADRLSSLSPESLSKPSSGIGRFQREGKVLYRVRAGDLRCYFEISGNTLFSHYILPEKSVADFAFRNGLRLTDEVLAEQHASFWKYLESLNK